MACDHPILTAGDSYRTDALLRRVPARAWQWVSAGHGAKGHRLDDWRSSAWTTVTPILVARLATTGCWCAATAPPASWLRPLLDTRSRALSTLVRVAGRRWTIEERFQTAKGLGGLDSRQVRRWCSWYRWTTLAMVAHAVRVVLAATYRTGTHHRPG